MHQSQACVSGGEPTGINLEPEVKLYGCSIPTATRRTTLVCPLAQKKKKKKQTVVLTSFQINDLKVWSNPHLLGPYLQDYWYCGCLGSKRFFGVVGLMKGERIIRHHKVCGPESPSTELKHRGKGKGWEIILGALISESDTFDKLPLSVFNVRLHAGGRNQ